MVKLRRAAFGENPQLQQNIPHESTEDYSLYYYHQQGQQPKKIITKFEIYS